MSHQNTEVAIWRWNIVCPEILTHQECQLLKFNTNISECSHYIHYKVWGLKVHNIAFWEIFYIKFMSHFSPKIIHSDHKWTHVVQIHVVQRSIVNNAAMHMGVHISFIISITDKIIWLLILLSISWIYFHCHHHGPNYQQFSLPCFILFIDSK